MYNVVGVYAQVCICVYDMCGLIWNLVCTYEYHIHTYLCVYRYSHMSMNGFAFDTVYLYILLCI